jgi:hypothetical protein
VVRYSVVSTAPPRLPAVPRPTAQSGVTVSHRTPRETREARESAAMERGTLFGMARSRGPIGAGVFMLRVWSEFHLREETAMETPPGSGL